jgi:hypothetical protein
MTRDVIHGWGVDMAWWLNRITAVSAFTGCLAMVGAARAEEPGSLDPTWLTTTVDERGRHCDRRAEQRDEKRSFVACGVAGVWEIALDEAKPRFIRSYDFSGDVVGFITQPDGLWVKLQVLEARPFTPGGAPPAVAFPDAAPLPTPALVPAPTPAASAPTTPLTPSRPTTMDGKNVGRVTRSEPGQVIISLGSLDGVGRGNHIELAMERSDDAGDEAGDDAGLSRETLAIGVVTNVTEHSARVRLGIGEDAPVGAVATPTVGQLTGSLSAPPRARRLWDLELFARPFVAWGELGGGALLSASVGYRFEHLHLQALVDPLGVADVQDKSAITTVNAALIASYDSQYFEMGLGFGAQTVNDPNFLLEPGSGLTALQLVRFGSPDGLNVSARTNIVLFHSEFQFGGMVATGQIPVTPGYWLLLNGGGGSIGYGFGELGMRMLLRGNALAGSTFLTITAGGAAVFRSPTCDEFGFCGEDLVYGGPMAGIGGEWRF